MNVTSHVVGFAAACLVLALAACGGGGGAGAQPAGITIGAVGGAVSGQKDVTTATLAVLPPPDVVITMNPNGGFTPQHVSVADGQAVKWVLYNRTTDAIARVSATTWPAVCSSTATYGADANELTGPMRRAQSGVFTLSPDKYGYAVKQLGDMTIAQPYNLCPVTGDIQNVGIPLDGAAPGSGPYLCEQTGDASYYQKSHETETWDSPHITGVFIRLRWSDVNPSLGVYDWATVLDREIVQAVAKNKFYSVAILAGEDGTPDWIFNAAPPVTRMTLDANEKHGACRYRSFGDVADPDYATHYKAMLTSLAAHLKSNTDWYRRLAYIKPSGANNTTAENRLPNGCKSIVGANCGGVPSCNNQTWVAAGYTPQKLYDYYQDVVAHIAAEFPDKSMSYALIQDGFPKANADGGSDCYENASGASSCTAGFSIPRGTEQTEHILDTFRTGLGVEAVVQHNGLGYFPTCAAPGTTAAGCPNWWAYKAGDTLFAGTTYGQVIGYQTTNANEVNSPLNLHWTFQNGWNNSSASVFEIYEAVHWKARNTNFGILNMGQGEPLQTIAGWRDALHGRRNLIFPANVLPSTSPAEHRVVFTRTAPPGTVQKHYFINPVGTACASNSAAWGSVSVGGF
jgi:Beta-galactosidase